jgi:hypothetical protein
MTQNLLGVEAMEASFPLPDFDKLGLRTQADHPISPNLNNLVSVAACDTTCSLRVPGQLNYDLREHMIPLPLSPLLYDCSAPLVSGGSSNTVP